MTLRSLRHRTIRGVVFVRLVVSIAALVMAGPAIAHDPNADPEGDAAAKAAGHASLAEIGAKLSNPVSDTWALFTQFGLNFSDGDVNTGDSEVSASILFEPILPIPLYGKGDDAWKMIVRPTIPILIQSPAPTGFDRFDRNTAFGDISVPFLVAPPAGNWLLGFGPNFEFPTATIDAIGREQFSVGPAGLLGWKNKDITLGVLADYYFGIGSIGDQADKPDASHMTLLYFFYYNLPKAWQVGFNPTVTYDNKASPGNHWNVPIGITVAKTTKIGKMPVKFQFGIEYSAVSQDDFGQRLLIKLNIIPVIQSLVKNPILGGG
jgi:hypothetical protein